MGAARAGGGPGRAVLAVLVAVVVLATCTPDAAAGPLGSPVRYRAPVPGGVVRAFEAPAGPYGPGHRGVDLAARPGEVVRAAAGGEVVFAGSVGGRRWVSIEHVDAVVTSYGPLTGPGVPEGSQVSGGAAIGRLAGSGPGHGGGRTALHVGARIDGAYVDPLALFPVDVARPSLVGPGGWEAVDRAVTPYRKWGGGRLGGWLVAGSGVAERPGFAVPPNPNHLVLVPGLSSSSAFTVLESAHLGYDPASVTRLSYAGRHREGGDHDDPRRDQLPFGPSDTWEGTGPAARRLARQLRAQAAREPGRAVDLVGHSMGGVVILRYLLEHHDPFDPRLPPIGHVVTIASPLNGSDVAELGTSLLEHDLAGPVLRGVQERYGLGDDELPLDAPVIAELAVGSSVLAELAVDWERALGSGTAGPLALGTRVLTIGGSTDGLVAAARARPPASGPHGGLPQVGGGGARPTGAFGGFGSSHGGSVLRADDLPLLEHRVLPGGHTEVLESEAVRQVTWQFLADRDVVASPGRLSSAIGRELGSVGGVLARLVELTDPLLRPGGPVFRTAPHR